MRFIKLFTFLTILLSSFYTLKSQTPLSGIGCPEIEKRSNGNGQASSAAGDFRPTYSQNIAVAPNVTGTSYQLVPYNPQSKTGNFNFRWPAASIVSNLPVISRVWTTPVGSETATLSPIKFGPPPVIYQAGNFKYANYCFYVQNMPNAGRVTLEFLDPQTNAPLFWCTYDLSSNLSAAQPTNFSCGPTVTTAPVSQTLCGDGSVTLTAAITGYTTYKWQQSANNSTWTDITAGGDFTTANATTLTINNRSTYTGKYFRISASNSCGTTNSTSALLTVNPLPTAVFTNSSSLCGLNVSRSLGVDFTGTGPWSFTYTTNGTPTTVSNITSDPYYFTVTPSVATTYILTSVSDSKCSNSSLSGNTSVAVYATPTISYTNTASVCEGSSNYSLVYSSTTGSPNQISMTTGTRQLSGFSAVSNANLTANSQTITIPSNGAPGDYDFNFTINNSSTGCTSSTYSLVLTIKPKPVMTASSSATSICSGSSVTITATGANTYAWLSSPSGFTSSSAAPSVSPTQSTTYTVTGTGSNNCTNTATTSVVVNSAPSPTITASNATICGGGQVTLTASGGNTYSWAGPSSYSATGSTVTFSPGATGTYTVTATGTNGCTASATQTITVSSAPTITLNDVTICQQASTTLSPSGATTYAWSTGATTASITVSPTSTTTYTVVGTSSGCSTSKSVTVTVTASPVTTIPPSQLLFCAADYGSNGYLNYSFTSSASVTCNWYRNSSSTWPSPIPSAQEITATSGQQYTRTGANNVSATTSTIGIKTPAAGDKFFLLKVISGSCTFDYYTEIIDITNYTANATSALNISSNQTICSGTSPATITLNGSNTGTSTYAYQWQDSTSAATWTDISTNGTSTTYSPGTLTTNTRYRIKITTTGGSCNKSFFSKSILITIASGVTNNTLSTTNACTAGTIITGSTPTGGSGSYTYSWESSTTSSSTGFAGVAGITTQSYTPPVPATTIWYRRLVTSGSCSNSTSTALAIHPPLTAIQISNGQTLCSGASITALSVTPTGGETSASYSYSWEKSTTSVSSGFSTFGAANSSSYTPITSAGNTEYFRVVVTKGACSSTSNAATIVVNSNPTITVTPSSATVCSGATETLTASGGVSYTWSPASDLSATTGASVVTTPTASRTYTATGTDANGCTNTATAIITFGNSPETPSLGSSSGTICNNSSKDLTTVFNGSWYTAPVVNPSYSVSTPTTVTAAGTYYVFALSGSCYSNSYASYALSVNDVTAPVPTDLSVEVCSPSTVNLTSLQPVATNGTTLKWFTVSSNPVTEYATPTTASAGTYYLYAYSTGGNCYGTASTGVVITQNSLPTVSLSPSSESVCEPNTIDLTTKISSPDNGYTYNWYSTSTNPPVTTDLVANPSSIASTGTFYVYALNNTTGCLSASPVTFTATVNADPALSLTSPSVGCSGASTSLEVAVTNGVSSPTYQWKIYNQSTGNFDNLGDGGVYSGATSTTLSISNITGLDGAAYYCAVTASGCSANSSVGVIGVSQPNVPTASVTHPTCTTTTGIINVTSYPNGLVFSIGTPSGYQSDTTFSNVATSASDTSYYTLTVKDSLTCTNSTSVKVNPRKPVPLAPTAVDGLACVYNLPVGTVTDNTGNGFVSPVFKWYTVNNADTSSNYNQKSTATTFQSRIMTTTKHYVAVVHPTSGCESSRTMLKDSIIDPLGTYSPFVNDYVWKGGAIADDNDWNTVTNWYQFDGTEYKTVNTIPSSSDNVFIPQTGTCIPAQPHVQNENTQQFINLTIKTGGSLTIEGNGIVNVSGDWTNDGTFTCATGTVNFLGSTFDSIKGSNSTTFYNVVVNKPSGEIKLFKQAYITGQLTLTDGLFDINTYDINMDSRTITGGSSTSYVQTSASGRLQRDVPASSVLFPVGRSAYNPATLTNTGTSDKFSIRVIDRLTNDGSRADLDLQSDSSVVKRTWMIDEDTPGGSDVTLRLDWNGAEHHGNFDDQQPYIAHYNSSESKWENKGWSSRTYSSGQGFVQTAGIINFSPFGISSPEGGVALPVELIYFNSNCDNDKTDIEWATASEHNSDYFSILTSEDGSNWRALDKIKAAGNSTEKLIYQYSLKNNSTAKYIKLDQFDVDGKKSVFGPFVIDCNQPNNELVIYPNPGHDIVYIQMNNPLKNTTAKLRLISSEGRIVEFNDVDFLKGNNSYQLNLDEELKGVFFIEFEESNIIQRKKIIIL